MKRVTTVLAILTLLGVAPVAATQTPSFVWWEAERPVRTNFPEPNPFAPTNHAEAAVLSAGNWIGVAGQRAETLFLEYDVAAPASGRYWFYVRKFWRHGPFRWRFDDQPWREVGRDVALLDSETLRTHVVANWVFAGEVELAAGSRRLRVELQEKSGAAAFDAFVLSRQPLIPRGGLKPGEKYDRAPEGWFAFEPEADPFGPSPMDLRGLNEKVAGENGFIQARGDQLVHGTTGKPVRFWAVNVGGSVARLDNASLDHMARFLAKRGVNMVRYHGTVYQDHGANVGQIDPAQIERVQYLVAAMKREGIYTTLSIYFPLWLRLDQAQGWPGYKDQRPFGLLFFHPHFQRIYRGWWRELLTRPNPHTGIPLGKDPAVAVLEMVNEDSCLFWTFKPYDNPPAPQMEILEKSFGAWLAKEYGSLQAAFDTWSGRPVRGDDAAAGRAGFMALYEIFTTRTRRAQDTAWFLARHQAAFFEQTQQYLKRELGFQGLIHASNWKAADARYLGPLEKYSNTFADLMDRHGYFGGRHEGDGASHSVRVGHRFADRTLSRFEPRDAAERGHSFDSPLTEVTYDGKPSLITEIDWARPNRFRAELPLLAAAYGSLQGTDGFYFFALSGPDWSSTLHSKWHIETASALGQYPAAALMFRQGLVRAAPAVVESDLNLDDLRALRGGPVIEPQNLDPLREALIPAEATAEVPQLGGIDPRAFYVGRVHTRFTTEPGRLRVADLSRYIDDNAKTIRSATGELFWDYDKGLVTVNAPAAQGATGFFRRAGRIELSDLTFTSDLDYGAILAVSLDGKPIATSGKMLLQVMSEDSNHGWQTASAAGLQEIKSLGIPPIVVRNLTGAIQFRRPDANALTVTALDFNGYPRQKIGPAATITLLPSTIYYLITAQ
jgi:hypothetical protein